MAINGVFPTSREMASSRAGTFMGAGSASEGRVRRASIGVRNGHAPSILRDQGFGVGVYAVRVSGKCREDGSARVSGAYSAP
jgi:hypothetical protein